MVNMKLIDAVLNNVTQYDDFEDFSCYHGNITRDEWQEYRADGWASEITPGTYNGATKKFTRVSKLTDSDIVNAIKSDIEDDEFIDISLQEFYPDKPNTPDVQALVYTEAYEVFTIGERLFADKG